MAGMLYLVPTPIGNLGDISIRCKQTLEEADFIAFLCLVMLKVADKAFFDAQVIE